MDMDIQWIWVLNGYGYLMDMGTEWIWILNGYG